MGSAVLPGFNGAFNGLIVLTGAQTLYKNGRPKQRIMEDMPRTQDFPSYGEFVKIASSTLIAAVRRGNYQGGGGDEEEAFNCYTYRIIIRECLVYIAGRRKGCAPTATFEC